MKNKSAQKIQLTSYDDLFGTSEQQSGEVVTSVPITQFRPFRNHPFRVLDDEKMQETVESVKRMVYSCRELFVLIQRMAMRLLQDIEDGEPVSWQVWRKCLLLSVTWTMTPPP